MTQEEKQLLLIDLCARQPYGVKFKAENEDSPIELHYVRDEDVYGRIYSNLPYWIEIIKPYLRPMSSMTKEEIRYKLSKFFRIINTNIEVVGYIPTLNSDSAIEYINWLNANHFDYRGLISMGLALEAPKGMYKTEGYDKVINPKEKDS